MLNFAHELGIERVFLEELTYIQTCPWSWFMLYTPEIDMEPKSHQINMEIIFKTHHFLWSIGKKSRVYLACLNILSLECSENNEKVTKKHGGPSDMDFFSDTERFGNDGVFSPWHFFFPSHLAATEPFPFFVYG